MSFVQGHNPQLASIDNLCQNCLKAKAIMWRVPGFEDGPWVDNIVQGASSSASDSEHQIPLTSHSSSRGGLPLLVDPVSEVLEILRLGSPLCYLFNAILIETSSHPDPNTLPSLPAEKTWKHIKAVDVNWQPDKNKLQECKRSAVLFIMAVRKELGWGSVEDQQKGNDIFTVNMLYDENADSIAKVISTVLRLLNLLGALGVLLPSSSDDDSALHIAASYHRDKIVEELLDTEQYHVQSLEKLQGYHRALQQNDILPTDKIHKIFKNLDEVVEFQRRFLVGVEANARLPADKQRFGHLFVTTESGFACYENYCLNFEGVSKILQDEKASLMKMSGLLDPEYELPSLLFRPLGRLGKYALLLQQLVKASPPMDNGMMSFGKAWPPPTASSTLSTRRPGN